jgi:hypothetical protein
MALTTHATARLAARCAHLSEQLPESVKSQSYVFFTLISGV